MTEVRSDVLHTFWFPQLQVRGAVVQLRSVLAELRARQGECPSEIQSALGQFLVASTLFRSGLKQVQRLTIQLQEAGALRLLFAECAQGGNLRGIARFDPDTALQLFPFVASARMAITLEQSLEQRYQGIVALEGENWSEAFASYFDRSEQLPTRMLLACDGRHGAGLLLQAMPQSESSAVDPDGWNRLTHLLATLGEPELLSVAPLDLLRRLFAEETVELLDTQPLQFACSCSRERVARVLASLGREECASVLQEQGQLQIACEFCGEQYVFDAVEVEAVFHPVLAPGSSSLM